MIHPAYPETLPPHDIPAEEAVLAAILVSSGVMPEVDDVLSPQMFFREAHGQTYAACHELWMRNEAINQITVAHELARRNQLEAVGGQSWLADIIQRLPTTVGVRYYADIIRRQHIAREVIRATDAIARQAYRAPDDLTETVPALITDLVESLRGGDTEQARLLSDIIDAQYLADLAAWCEQPAEVEGIPTGIPALDRHIGGLAPSRLHVIAGATSVGKSLLGQALARSLAESDYRVLIYTTEMSGPEVANRLIQQASGVNRLAARLRRTVTVDEARALKRFAHSVRKLPIRVRPGSLNLDHLIADVRRLGHAWPFDVLIIDHAHMIYVPELRRDRTLELERITSSLKSLAEDQQIPIVALAHMNRDGQSARAGELKSRRWSRMTDLHGASSLERDSNVVILMDPARWSNEDGEWVPMSNEEVDELPWDQRDITVRFAVAKARDGLRGVFWMAQAWSEGGRWHEIDMTYGGNE